MLRRVEPPSVDPDADPTEPHPQLTAGAYQGLEALIDFYREKRARHDVHLLTMVVTKLRRVPIADWYLAYSVAGSLEDGLAWHYRAYGWHETAEGWVEAARLVRQRARARETCC